MQRVNGRRDDCRHHDESREDTGAVALGKMIALADGGKTTNADSATYHNAGVYLLIGAVTALFPNHAGLVH